MSICRDKVSNPEMLKQVCLDYSLGN
ncbi:hypothetical protein TRIP_B50394 [uncultured Desulfatiglans sp.]|nr:hypothetical protein TRIP_B50394 [uncultured Desulfatiglans sp.]